MKLWVIWQNMPYLLGGLAVTLKIAGLVIVGGTLLGIVVGIMRTSSSWILKIPAWAYIEYIRGTPLLVVLFIVYFGLPPLLGVRLTAVQASVIGFILFIAAYIAEDVRSGLNGVPHGQVEAGRASGLKSYQVLAYIVLPQAVRMMIPTFFNQFVRLTKFTSVASIIGVFELTGRAGIVNAREFIPIESYLMLAVTYFIVCYSLSLVGRSLHRRLMIRT